MNPTPGPEPRPVGLDLRLTRAARRWGGHPPVAAGGRALSCAGEHAAVWLAVGLLGAALDRPQRQVWLRSTALVAGAHLVSMAVKRVARRPRPHLPGLPPLVYTAGTHSLPSSHAASSAAAAVAFRTLLPGPATALLAAAVCGSRLVVGVHYPTDVVAGAALGAATAALGRSWADG